MLELSFAKLKSTGSKVLVVTIGEGRKLSPLAAKLDQEAGGAITRAIRADKFSGKKGETLSLLAPGSLKQDRIVLLGTGKGKDVDALAAQGLGGKIIGHLNAGGVKEAAIAAELPAGSKLGEADFAVEIAYGARLKSYRFDKYRTKEEQDKKPTLAKLTVMTAKPDKAEAAFEPRERIAEGVFLTRNVVSEPANIIYPESLAAICKELTKIGVKVEVLGEKEMEKLGMGALLGVGQGSARESQLVVMQWNGASDKKAQPLAFVGKGVCFDTGGISIKPSKGMEEMKWDMGGAGAVIGLMKALAGRKAKVNVVGVVGLVENMPDGNAQRPGDVVTSMSGQTIEVINTDAEGRLVLADALWYTQDRFKPAFMIDLATLTGAIIVALADVMAGLFSSDDKLAERLRKAGEATGELVWRLPVGPEFDKMINSDIADVMNVGDGRGAGSITAAQFLKRFTNDVPWVHLDIAGVAWTKRDQDVCPKGATAFGVRLLDRFITDNYEGK